MTVRISKVFVSWRWYLQIKATSSTMDPREKTKEIMTAVSDKWSMSLMLKKPTLVESIKVDWNGLA